MTILRLMQLLLDVLKTSLLAHTLIVRRRAQHGVRRLLPYRKVIVNL